MREQVKTDSNMVLHDELVDYWQLCDFVKISKLNLPVVVLVIGSELSSLTKKARMSIVRTLHWFLDHVSLAILSII